MPRKVSCRETSECSVFKWATPASYRSWEIQVYIIAALKKKKREYAHRHHSHRQHPNVSMVLASAPVPIWR